MRKTVIKEEERMGDRRDLIKEVLSELLKDLNYHLLSPIEKEQRFREKLREKEGEKPKQIET